MTVYQAVAFNPVCPVSHNSPREDFACALIQATGLLLVLGGVSTLVALAGVFGDAWEIVSFSVYGATLISLYAFSALYHATRKLKRKQTLKVLDQANIYLLIAGTYTPFMLSVLKGAWGWSMFGVIWGLALTGVLVKVLFVDRFEKFSLSLYVVMGWLIVIVAVPFTERMALDGFLWMIAAGVSYTVGVLFYLSGKIPYNHALWHGFVLTGSAFFYFVMMFYVLFPPA